MGVTPTKKSPAKKGRSPAKERRSRSKASNATAFSAKDVVHSHVPPDPEQRKANGRVSGRDLIPWTRPRMVEKLMLHIQYECARYRINMPWDAIAHRFHPGSSGGAVVQYLNKLRRELVAEGHVVPPLAQKPDLTAHSREPNIRGYIRKYPHEGDKRTTRPVYFSEKIEDPKQSLPGGVESAEDQDQDDCEMEDDNALEDNEPLTPSPSQPPPIMTPTHTGRSGSLATSQSDGVLHEGREYHLPAHQAANSFDSVFGFGRHFPTTQNGQPVEYTYGPQLLTRSFDGDLGSQEGPLRPDIRPEPHWPIWPDNRGSHFMLHGANGMTTGRDIQQMYPSTNGFYMGTWGHPFNQPYGYHAPVANMHGAYASAQEQQAPRTPLSSPQKTPKLESPDKEFFSQGQHEPVEPHPFTASVDDAVADCQ